jgi:hypothetical protein
MLKKNFFGVKSIRLNFFKLKVITTDQRSGSIGISDTIFALNFNFLINSIIKVLIFALKSNLQTKSI